MREPQVVSMLLLCHSAANVVQWTRSLDTVCTCTTNVPLSSTVGSELHAALTFRAHH